MYSVLKSVYDSIGNKNTLNKQNNGIKKSFIFFFSFFFDYDYLAQSSIFCIDFDYDCFTNYYLGRKPNSTNTLKLP